MIDYIVDVLFWASLIAAISFSFGYDYAERKQFEKYEQWRLAVSRERLRRIREW